MPGLVPGIRVLGAHSQPEDVDGRDEPGHDDAMKLSKPHACEMNFVTR